MDTAICSSIGDTYGANLQPMEQLQHAIKLLEPIADKILCITSGNHERRVYKTDGIDLMSIVSAQLKIAKVYTPTTGFIFLRFGNNHRNKCLCYTIYCTHGSGGGRREGGKINRLADLANIVDADLYIHSHTHLPAVFKTGYYRVDNKNSFVAYVDKTFVNTAAALDYGGYGDVQGYKPSSKENPVIYFDGHNKNIKVKL